MGNILEHRGSESTPALHLVLIPEYRFGVYATLL